MQNFSNLVQGEQQYMEIRLTSVTLGWFTCRFLVSTSSNNWKCAKHWNSMIFSS